MAATMNYDLGPQLGSTAPAFQLVDGHRRRLGLDDLLGRRGLLLGFSGDIWRPVTMRRIVWLQRHITPLQSQGVTIALLVGNPVPVLSGFQAGSGLELDFPMLSDPDYHVHQLFSMHHTDGLVLLNRQRHIRSKWLALNERGWPHLDTLIQACMRL